MFSCCSPLAIAKSRAESFATGRMIIGLIAILTGLQLWSYGHETLEPRLHELRKTFYPSSHSNSALCSGTQITWEELNRYTIQAEAGMFILSGFCILLNIKCFGSFLLLIGSSVILGVRDYPWLRHSALKSVGKERSERLSDVVRNLALIGCALILMMDRSPSCCSGG